MAESRSRLAVTLMAAAARWMIDYVAHGQSGTAADFAGTSATTVPSASRTCAISWDARGNERATASRVDTLINFPAVRGGASLLVLQPVQSSAC
jgi:hypothetical protein